MSTKERIDNDTIKIIETRETIIDLKKLRNEIILINQQLNDLPQKKIKPDNETLDYWNNEHQLFGLKEYLIEQKNKIEKELFEFEKVK
jgi:hypothetical protein